MKRIQKTLGVILSILLIVGMFSIASFAGDTDSDIVITDLSVKGKVPAIESNIGTVYCFDKTLTHPTVGMEYKKTTFSPTEMMTKVAIASYLMPATTLEECYATGVAIWSSIEEENLRQYAQVSAKGALDYYDMLMAMSEMVDVSKYEVTFFVFESISNPSVYQRVGYFVVTEIPEETETTPETTTPDEPPIETEGEEVTEDTTEEPDTTEDTPDTTEGTSDTTEGTTEEPDTTEDTPDTTEGTTEGTTESVTESTTVEETGTVLGGFDPLPERPEGPDTDGNVKTSSVVIAVIAILAISLGFAVVGKKREEK